MVLAKMDEVHSAHTKHGGGSCLIQLILTRQYVLPVLRSECQDCRCQLRNLDSIYNYFLGLTWTRLRSSELLRCQLISLRPLDIPWDLLQPVSVYGAPPWETGVDVSTFFNRPGLGTVAFVML